jgi:Circadian oscillating protein COP23
VAIAGQIIRLPTEVSMHSTRPFSLLLTVLLASTAGIVVLSPVRADIVDPKFYCGTSKNAPTTMARTSRGSVSIIHWTSTNAFGENYPPEVRCKLVSSKFQEYYTDGTLNFLTTGVLNRQPVICAVQSRGGPCGVLFTLKPGSDPDLTLKRLLSIRDRSTTLVLNESISAPVIDFNDFLETAPVEEISADSSPTPITKADTITPSSAPLAPELKSLW